MENRKVKQVIVWRKDLKVRKGKMAAQVAHASLGVILDMMTETRRTESEETMRGYTTMHVTIKHLELNSYLDNWINGKFTKIVLGCENESELLNLYIKVKEVKIPTKLITDAGLTEFNGVPTNTCIAIGPFWAEDIDKFTKNLKLM